jgi:malonate-semialdehyde dehydrogenase (acetylating)/methylmalonate-semialdehyde dehydrogenase
VISVEIRRIKNYINGEWVEADNNGYLDVENPSTGDIISQVPLSTVSETERTLEAAYKAFTSWRNTPVAHRVSFLFKLQAIVRANENKIARILAEEMGKSIPDSSSEVKRLIKNIEVACVMPVFQQGDKVINSSFDSDGEVIRLPLGVFTMISQFNFPTPVPFRFIPYAIATGNTFVVKPSEQAPCTMQLITEYIDKTELPPGVFNLVNGDKTVSNAFIDSIFVKGVSMVGTSSVCRIIAEKCAKTNKRFQAMGSAKNHLVVMPDARVQDVVRNMITSCYGSAGQGCMAASAVICVGDNTYNEICTKFIEASKKVIVANPSDPKVSDEAMIMGPVISQRAEEKILGLIEDGIKEGATLALDGRGVVVKGCEKGHFIGPTVFIDVKPGMKIHSIEIFGPVVVILKADTLDEAIRVINDHEYGNVASIYTQDSYNARKFKLGTEAGMISINTGILDPVANLPLGGMKASLFADIKAQGKEVVNFFTETRIVMERYLGEG